MTFRGYGEHARERQPRKRSRGAVQTEIEFQNDNQKSLNFRVHKHVLNGNGGIFVATGGLIPNDFSVPKIPRWSDQKNAPKNGEIVFELIT